MSIDFSKWLGGSGNWVQPQIQLRASIQFSRILDKPTDVQFTRAGVTLDPQTVRVEYDNSMLNEDGMSGLSTLRRGIIFGFQGHPDYDDTDIQAWDTFVMDDKEFTVATVNHQLHGQIQATFEGVG